MRRAEQCQLPIKIICIKLDSYDVAAGSVCLHAIKYRNEDWSKSFEGSMFVSDHGSQTHLQTNKNTNGWRLFRIFHIVEKM